MFNCEQSNFREGLLGIFLPTFFNAKVEVAPFLNSQHYEFPPGEQEFVVGGNLTATTALCIACLLQLTAFVAQLVVGIRGKSSANLMQKARTPLRQTSTEVA